MASTRLTLVSVVEKLTKPDSKSSKKRMSPGAAWAAEGKPRSTIQPRRKAITRKFEPVLNDALGGAQNDSIISHENAHRRDIVAQFYWILRPRAEAT